LRGRKSASFECSLAAGVIPSPTGTQVLNLPRQDIVFVHPVFKNFDRHQMKEK
jgi:hypothetical protein